MSSAYFFVITKFSAFTLSHVSRINNAYFFVITKFSAFTLSHVNRINNAYFFVITNFSEIKKRELLSFSKYFLDLQIDHFRKFVGARNGLLRSHWLTA